jgi:N-acetylglucosaminyl-diphospho-decaprenol L-rhamnosyltransferase
MNKDLTIVFSSYQSQYLLKKILKQLKNKYKIIIVENSLDSRIKKQLEAKHRNVSVIIPKQNLGLAKSYNLGIRRAKTPFVFLNNPDIEIKDKAIKNLITCAKKIKNFGVISPTYKIQKIYKNYEILNAKEKNTSKVFKKFGITEVDLIDNNFLLNKNKLGKTVFDENFFLYFETIDFTKSLQKKGKRLFVAKNIKFHHYGSSSLPKSFSNLVNKTRAFHYNWSKFYYFKKNISYFYALTKSFNSIIKVMKNLCINLLKFDLENLKLNLLELTGIFSAILCLKSYYRPNK